MTNNATTTTHLSLSNKKHNTIASPRYGEYDYDDDVMNMEGNGCTDDKGCDKC